MTTAWLCQIDAWDGLDAAPLCLASHDDERLCHLGEQTWWPAIARLPTLRYDLFDGAFGNAITEPGATIEVAIGAVPSLPALAIHDARLRLWRGTLGDAFSAFTLVVDGRVTNQPEVAAGRASIPFGVDSAWLDEPLLDTYEGTGGVEGGVDLTGQPKPLLFGAPRFVEGVLLDSVAQIYQLHGYGPMRGVDLGFNRLSRYPGSVGDTGNYAGLDASDIPAGRWATCVSEGLVRLGAPPDAPLTFHAQGDNTGGWRRTPGEIIGRIADLRGASSRVAPGTLAALDAARPWELSLSVTEQTTARDLIQRIAASVNAVATIGWLGYLVLTPIGIGAPTLTLAADGSALPPVGEVRQTAVAAPWWRLAIQSERTWRVHQLSEIAFTAPFVPLGQYRADRAYREGNIVTLADGSSWLFVGEAAATGSMPADDNPDWERTGDRIVPTDASGNALELLVADAIATNDRARAIFWQETAPSASESEPNDLWIQKSTGISYIRVAGSGRLAVGGRRFTVGGSHVTLCWAEAADQRIGQAILAAAGAQATADGKAEVFTMFASSDPEPTGTGVGDLLIRAYLSPPQVDHWNGSTWISAATYGATAEQAADIEAMASDGVLSKLEKVKAIDQWEAVNREYTAQNAKAAVLGVAATERSNAASKLSALGTYLSGLSPAWNDTTTDTVIVPGAYRGYWNDTYTANATLAAAVLGAPTGTPVGTISAGDVSGTIKSGGGINTNQVDTASVQNNAITDPIGAYSAGTVSSTTGETVAQSASVSVGSTGSVIVLASCQWSGSNSAPSMIYGGLIRLYRDGTLLREWTGMGGGNGFEGNFSSSLVDTPPATSTHTYELRILNLAGATAQFDASKRSLALVYQKK